MRYAILATLVATAVGPATAPPHRGCDQQGGTLLYREVTEGELTLYTPAGARLLGQTHVATIALAFGATDSVTAWYDSLAVEAQSLEGRQRPATALLLRQPFQLRCDARGRLTTLRAPRIPQEILEITDLSQEFTDFLVRTPTVALEVGVEWTDTLAHLVPETGGTFRKYTAYATWRVQTDTLYAGTRAWILTGRSRLSLEAGDLAPRHSGQAVSVLAGEEQGRAILAEGGRLLSRTKQGNLAGQLTIRSGSKAQSFQQDYHYESRITHVP
jgi:hypothetical protein